MTDNINISKLLQGEMDSIKKGSVELIKEDELYGKLERSLKSGVPLKIKVGFDPTSPDIHLGHTVLLNKLRTFQEYGHEVFFIIGDFTAIIGDPTGRSEIRKPLSKQEIFKNSETYKEQAFKVLKPEMTKIIFNSWWLSNIGLDNFIRFASNYTVARMLEKDDFEKRFKSNRPVAIHEFIYPLLQGIDSVFVKADLELGGNDQKFNLAVGRELMKSAGLVPQVVMTMPLLEGLDGINKMSKSLGNAIGIFDEPGDMFGKIMSISDTMMIKYYELLSSISIYELNKLKQDIEDSRLNPLIAKKSLAKEIVTRYWGEKKAEGALKYFEDKFQKRIEPEDIEVKELKASDIYISNPPAYIRTPESASGPVSLGTGDNLPVSAVNILIKSSAVKSNSEAKRLIKQGGVKISFFKPNAGGGKGGQNNESKITADRFVLPENITEFIIKVGKKKIYKIKINKKS